MYVRIIPLPTELTLSAAVSAVLIDIVRIKLQTD